MNIFLLLVLALCLMSVIYQDLKFRLIHVALPIIISLTGIGFLNFNSIPFYFIYFNIGFIFLSFLFVFLFFKIKYKSKIKDFFDKYLGVGDVVFYLSISPFFILTNFILIYICTLIFSMILALIFNKKTSIPLAGYSSILLLILFMLDFLQFTNFSIINFGLK